MPSTMTKSEAKQAIRAMLPAWGIGLRLETHEGAAVGVLFRIVPAGSPVGGGVVGSTATVEIEVARAALRRDGRALDWAPLVDAAGDAA